MRGYTALLFHDSLPCNPFFLGNNKLVMIEFLKKGGLVIFTIGGEYPRFCRFEENRWWPFSL
ncbi:MAG: hypothetical protein D3903_03550 [Candidatus Electrothrix sp. GM3_4]|nr:hypothetical protein [Candidatus Electrothrix sp. GM3_4]